MIGNIPLFKLMKITFGMIGVGLLSACDPCFFHCSGLKQKSSLIEFTSGPYKVFVFDVNSDFDWEVDNLRSVRVAWSETEIERVHAARGYKPATLANYISVNERLIGRSLTAIELERLQSIARSFDGKKVLFPDGTVGRCGLNLSKSRWCGSLGGPLRLSVSKRAAIMQIGLDQLSPRCQIVSTQPHVLAGGNKNAELGNRLTAEVTCS